RRHGHYRRTAIRQNAAHLVFPVDWHDRNIDRSDPERRYLQYQSLETVRQLHEYSIVFLHPVTDEVSSDGLGPVIELSIRDALVLESKQLPLWMLLGAHRPEVTDPVIGPQNNRSIASIPVLSFQVRHRRHWYSPSCFVVHFSLPDYSA